MAVMEGSLSKWTNVMKGWQYRWFVLDDNSGLLTYYTSKEKMMRGARRGCVRLKGAVIGIDDEDDSTFTVTVDHKTFHFQARDAEEREKWVRALEDTIFRHGNPITWDLHRPPPTIKDFDNKVSEADAYLQLMIEQTKKLEERIGSMSESEDKNKCYMILDHANRMLDNIKHSIVLLQIAKHTAHPVNGIYQQRTPSINTSSHDLESNAVGGAVVQQGIELGSECIENSRRHTLGASSNLAVPAMSYSSSEGEDDFYDANDDPFTPGSQLPSPTSFRSTSIDTPISTSQSNTITTNEGSLISNTTNDSTIVVQSSLIPKNKESLSNNLKTRSFSLTKEEIDEDALYEDEDDSDIDLESTGSVIRHLLSQVKIGMDLTKVVLPTFILERRSLLEMYADFFAHPDIFIKISEYSTPKERMVQCLKWYLSAYHAGRKSSVAKKPYNPILGEIFRCYWDLPPPQQQQNDNNQQQKGQSDDTTHLNSTNDDLNKEGPVPWSKKNQLQFVAEQVSHHPPVSAFYAEHYDKRISFNAHIYTKSKFLGLSVCVYNIGQGVVTLIDHDEEYFITFPNGYGRSILTVPWIELGGEVHIVCPKTGYQSNIEFLTKPFYGNKKHKITAEVVGPDKKPFLTVSGEWNGLMEAKWSHKSDTEEFVNVQNLNIIKKQVQPISQQNENESRRLWKDVTIGLKHNDIDRATRAKQNIEQKQRDEAKARKEEEVEWETKLFKSVGEDSWEYKLPLKKRLV